jgi:GDP-L-fucose synthase
MVNKKSKIFIAGHNGLVGNAVYKKFKKEGFKKLIIVDKKKLNLINQSDVDLFFRKNKFDYLIMCAAKVGGIMSNSTYPTEFLYENIMIQSNLLKAAFKYKVKRTIFLGTSCVYPKFAKTPIKEKYLLSGKLEKTNEFYAIAKISGIKLCEAMHKQYNFDVVCVMPTNMYGTKDNHDNFNSHVIPGIISKVFEAKKREKNKLELWGSGKPKREFLFVDDFANAIYLIINKTRNEINKNSKNQFPIYNVGSGEELSIKELAFKIKRIFNYKGKVFFNTKFPDGTFKKNLDSGKIIKLGWKAKVKLEDGLKILIENYIQKIKR